MKFVCLGHADAQAWDALPKSEQEARIEACFAYDEQLQRQGHWLAGGQALQSPPAAKALRWKDGRVVVTDGPFAETKEQLGGFGVLEARDMAHAVELMSQHPGVQIGPFEIRPIDENKLRQQLAERAKVEHGSLATAAPARARTGNFACLGFIAEQQGAAIPMDEFDAMIAECIEFDKQRQRSGQWVSGIALQSASTAKSLRSTGSQVIVTDGPFAETKEQLGGVVVLALADMNSAVELLLGHPALRFGVGLEIRPIDERMTARWEARKAG